MGAIQDVERKYLRTDLPEFRVGDTVRMKIRIREGAKERLQPFEGTIIRIRGGSINTTFTIRKFSHGIGVERIFPLHSPVINSIEVLTRAKIRRSRLYYLRELKGKSARLKVRR